MGSPSVIITRGMFTGASDDVPVIVSFRPRSIHFAVNNSGSGEFGYKSEKMIGDAYISTTSGADAGVTITDTGFTVADGADINVDGVTVYFEAVE